MNEKTIDEALSGQYDEKWKEASRLKYQSLMDNDTWDLREAPRERRLLDASGSFKVKHNSEDVVEKFKCSLVAKGYSQRYSISLRKPLHP